jgi:LysR family transcriptional activator of mexEF-oprN operon
VVEDALGLQRRVRISVPSFQGIPAAIDGTGLLATVPEIVAREILKARPDFATAALPFQLESAPTELVWRNTQDDAGALRFVRNHITRIAAALTTPKTSRRRRQ